MEEHLGTHFMVEILERVECSHRHMKEVVRRYDRLILADLCRVNAPAIIAVAQPVDLVAREGRVPRW